MPYKIGFKLDDGRTLWLKQTYASKSYAEKVMKRERAKLLEMGVKLTIPYVVKANDGNLKLATRSTAPSGTSRVPSGKASSETYIKPWYCAKYPTDSMGQDINPKATFKGALDVLKRANTTSDFYDYINAHDSVIRERIFDELARRTNQSYDTIYRAWLGTASLPNSVSNTSKPSKNAGLGGKVKVGDIFAGHYGVTGFPEYFKVIRLKGEQSAEVAKLQTKMEYVQIFDPPYNQNYTYREWPTDVFAKTTPASRTVKLQIRNGEVGISDGKHWCPKFNGKPWIVYSYMD